MAAVEDHTKVGISFGAFTLFAGERLLIKEGVPVKLGARARYPGRPDFGTERGLQQRGVDVAGMARSYRRRR